MRCKIKIAFVGLLAFSMIAKALNSVNGYNGMDQPPTYVNVSTALATDSPEPRRESIFWTDSRGVFWLFGGWSYAGGYLNDLWKFDGANWIWVSGSASLSVTSVYGTKGVAAPENMPSSRAAAVSWVDRNDDLWLFGGSGYDGQRGVWGVLNDLWKFDGRNWIWVGGSSSFSSYGIYGTKGSGSAVNIPGARYGGVSWTDRAGNFWLFGGWGYDGVGGFGWLNDLWEFDGANWTWVSGSNFVNQPGVYGTQGEAAAANVPGARWGSVSWVDPNDNLWLFGGVGNWGMNFNDLWKFDGTDWTWVSGSETVNELGSYGEKGIASAGNVPGARNHSSSWVDPNGNLWLFGGWDTTGFFDDLWKFDGANWTWVGGSQGSTAPGINGLASVPYYDERVNARWAAAAWADTDGSLWLFGGWNTSGYYNDLRQIFP